MKTFRSAADIRRLPETCGLAAAGDGTAREVVDDLGLTGARSAPGGRRQAGRADSLLDNSRTRRE